MMTRRVVISGCGLVSAAGNELERFWGALMSGTSFVQPLRDFSAPDAESLSGAAVELAAEDRLPESVDVDPRRARCLEFSLAASRRAWADAALSAASADLSRIGVVLGSTIAEERQVGDLSERMRERGAEAIDGAFFARSNNQRLAACVAQAHGLGGPALLAATACSSGNTAITFGYDMIASGDAEVMLTGGADTFTRLIYCGFQRMSALSKSVCKPFDKARDGVSFGEGAGVVVLEELEHARRRGARIYAEVAGYGISNDAHHVTAPSPNGEGFVRAVQQALQTTNTGLDQVDYVSAHGTGTPYNDAGEYQAMKAVFGESASRIPISSIKGMIGHTNGAAAAIEAIACALAIKHQALPPTANLSDPEFDLDLIPGKGRSARVDTCISLAAGFGGFNACLVLKRLA
jgi:3-oxoacyl-[acyl-carrier-protein] synthase II